jgi:methyl-accepting chemotaxis protein
MRNTPFSSQGSPAVGLLLVTLLGVLGAVTVVIAHASGAPTWLATAVIPIGLLLYMLFVVLVYLPQRALQGDGEKADHKREHAEGVFLTALDHLRTGNLADTLSGAKELPEEFEAAFTSAASALGALVEQIQKTSTDVAAAGTGVHATASELASGSSEQAAAVVEITATMEELARTAAQIAANAASQAELADRSEHSGDQGVAAVEEAVRGVEEVQKRISGIAARADTLGTRSKEIYRVLDLITEIAQETHILALNAAIEAAAAGEHGRRFAVVADEVRRLAQRSRESADSVRNLLEEFSGSIRATVVATEEGSKEASRVLERARSAAASIEELRAALADTARPAKEISLATQQQRAASDQVVLTLKEVSQVIQRMAEGLKNFSGTADRLNQLALSIQLLTQSFHLDSPRSLKHLASQWAVECRGHLAHLETVGGLTEEIIGAHPFVEMAYVASREGVLLASSFNSAIPAERVAASGVKPGFDFRERLWFQTAMREQGVILTPLYESLLTREPHFTVATAVRDARGEVGAVLAFDVNVRDWTKI